MGAEMKGPAGVLLLLGLIVSAYSAPTSKAAGTVHWPAPSDPMQLARRAGLVPEVNEHLAYHVHAHLDVFVNRAKVPVPAGIGINIHDPGVHVFKAGNTVVGYGGIQR